MEHLNIERKRLSELVKEAEKKNMQVVLVEEPIIDGHHRVAALIESEHFMVISTKNLLEEDQQLVNSTKEQLEEQDKEMAKLFGRLPEQNMEELVMKIEALPELVEPFILDESKSFPVRNLKFTNSPNKRANVNLPVRKNFNHRRH